MTEEFGRHPILDCVEDFEEESSNSSSSHDNCVSSSSQELPLNTDSPNSMMFQLGNNQIAKINFDQAS